MNILVTGGAGYVGYFVTKKLLERGHQVAVLDNLTYGSKALEPFIGAERFKFVYGDIGNLKDVIKATKGNEVVIALAAIVGDPACGLDEDETIRSNYLATKLLLDACKHYGVQRIVFASSCSVYGDTKNAIASEAFPLNPLSLYAKTRAMSEEILLNEKSLSVLILRLATVFGVSRRMRFDLVVNTLTSLAHIKRRIVIHGDGKQWRPNIHVQDAAEAFVQAALLPQSKTVPRLINIGDEQNNLTINQVVQLVKKHVPDVEVSHDPELKDPRNYRINFDRVNEVLDLQNLKTVQEGVKEISTLISHKLLDNIEDDIYYNVRYLTKTGFNPKERITIIAPMYNESPMIGGFFNTFNRILSRSEYEYDFLIVDDGSTDDTVEKLQRIKDNGYPVTIVKLDRNYGQHSALSAGLEYVGTTKTDYAFITDADLQNPPEQLMAMLRHMKETRTDIVYGIRRDFRVGNGVLSKLFWLIIASTNKNAIPRDQSSLKVVNRAFIDKYKRLEMKADFFPRALAAVDAKVGYYPVNTVARKYGSTRYSQSAKIKLFLLAFRSTVLRINSHEKYRIEKIISK